jgi:hypothetical protein
MLTSGAMHVEAREVDRDRVVVGDGEVEVGGGCGDGMLQRVGFDFQAHCGSSDQRRAASARMMEIRAEPVPIG